MTAASSFAGAGETFVVKNDNHAVSIDSETFCFQLVGFDGKVFAPAHKRSGLLINGHPVVSVEKANDNNTFELTTVSGDKAAVALALVDGLVTVVVTPAAETRTTVCLQLGGMPVAHGLGDAGGWNETFNLVGETAKVFNIINDGGKNRWASSFVIFPPNRVAGVALGDDTTSVTVGPDAYSMEVTKAGSVTFHYLLGDMHAIYNRYLALRAEAGYPNIKPTFKLFELGWETWAALGWTANATTVQSELSRLLSLGFPVRWAVTGSGFWVEGGTTTNFGQFGEKFPDPDALKRWLNSQNIKWMIGLRTNFVPSGGPFTPDSEKRNRNLKGNYYNGNPISVELTERGYLLTDDNQEPIKVTSQWFPQVPCYLLDGRNKLAARWYADQYKLWGVDGIKEDTMMKCNVGIFDGPISNISNDGALVIARCGSFSSPGTLLRINDTNGAAEMGARIPINYLQYAACGAPNTYSDTIGFKDNRERVENLRHGWLMACTAGLAIGPFEWKNPELVDAFKRMIRFHYEIAPTKYDAAIKSYRTGYPYTMTPLSIAYPEDSKASATASFEWMIGESLLAAPLVKNVSSNRLELYLPEGVWFDYNKGKRHQGPIALADFLMPIDVAPCFVGGKGVIVTRDSDESPLTAKVYPTAGEDSLFTFNYPDGESQSLIDISYRNEEPTVRDVGEDRDSPFVVCEESGAVSFSILPGHQYRVTLDRRAL